MWSIDCEYRCIDCTLSWLSSILYWRTEYVYMRVCLLYYVFVFVTFVTESWRRWLTSYTVLRISSSFKNIIWSHQRPQMCWNLEIDTIAVIYVLTICTTIDAVGLLQFPTFYHWNCIRRHQINNDDKTIQKHYSWVSGLC